MRIARYGKTRYWAVYVRRESGMEECGKHQQVYRHLLSPWA